MPDTSAQAKSRFLSEYLLLKDIDYDRTGIFEFFVNDRASLVSLDEEELDLMRSFHKKDHDLISSLYHIGLFNEFDFHVLGTEPNSEHLSALMDYYVWVNHTQDEYSTGFLQSRMSNYFYRWSLSSAHGSFDPVLPARGIKGLHELETKIQHALDAASIPPAPATWESLNKLFLPSLKTERVFDPIQTALISDGLRNGTLSLNLKRLFLHLQRF